MASRAFVLSLAQKIETNFKERSYGPLSDRNYLSAAAQSGSPGSHFGKALIFTDNSPSLLFGKGSGNFGNDAAATFARMILCKCDQDAFSNLCSVSWFVWILMQLLCTRLQSINHTLCLFILLKLPQGWISLTTDVYFIRDVLMSGRQDWFFVSLTGSWSAETCKEIRTNPKLCSESIIGRVYEVDEIYYQVRNHANVRL